MEMAGEFGIKSEEEIAKEMQRDLDTFKSWRLKNAASKINVRCDQKRIEKITDLLLVLRSTLNQYRVSRLIGMVPEEILNWIEYGRKHFNWHEKVVAGLDSLEYGVYSEVLTYWQFSQAVQKAIKKQGPTNIDERNRLALVELRKYTIPKDRLTSPMGKNIGRRKYKKSYDPINKVLTREPDNAPGKHWPIVRKTIIEIYDLLRPLYSDPYGSKLIKSITALMKTDDLEDLTEGDISSTIEYRYLRQKPKESKT